jgi:site-specific DNA recombinase
VKRTRRRRPTDPNLAIGYVRVSKDEGQVSPDVQRGLLERWAAERGKRLIAVHQDLGVSGATRLDRRPGLVAALADLQVHGAGVLVAIHRDRFARDRHVAAELEFIVTEQRARLVALDGTGESDSPEDVFQRALFDALAQYKRLWTKVRTRQALAHRRAEGRVTGPCAPYGFAAQGKHLVPAESERAAAARAAELAEAGASLRAIGRQLSAENFIPRGRAWHTESVRRLLRLSEDRTVTS